MNLRICQDSLLKQKVIRPIVLKLEVKLMHPYPTHLCTPTGISTWLTSHVEAQTLTFIHRQRYSTLSPSHSNFQANTRSEVHYSYLPTPDHGSNPINLHSKTWSPTYDHPRTPTHYPTRTPTRYHPRTSTRSLHQSPSHTSIIACALALLI